MSLSKGRVTNQTGATVVLPDPLACMDTVWLHGAGLAGDTWHPITTGYTNARTPDLPGHGSAPLAHPHRVETYAECLLEGVPDGAVLIGHSLGGMIALELAARLPDRIAALILIEAVPTVRDRLSERLSATVAAFLMRKIPTAWLARLAGLGECRDTKVELRRQMTRMDQPRISAALAAASQYDGRPNLARISVPTLIIVGKQSAAANHGAQLMAPRMPSAELLRLPGGHMLHTDNPVQLRRSISAFLNRIGEAG
jgi:pimeloyl-ACP methyl ester carboxylesterase